MRDRNREQAGKRADHLRDRPIHCAERLTSIWEGLFVPNYKTIQIDMRFAASSIVVIVSTVLWSSEVIADAADRGPLIQTLLLEARAQADDRGEILETVLKTNPNDHSTRWQAGYVRAGSRWWKYDRPFSFTKNGRLQSNYRQLREQLPQNHWGRLQLADWCRDHGLVDQERAHLIEALRSENPTETAFLRLGFRQVAGIWLSGPERVRLRAELRQKITESKKWRPTVEKIRDDLMSKSTRRQRIANRRLNELDHEPAIDTIGQILFDGNESVELAAVEALRVMSNPSAAEWLADRAVASENLWVRNSALSALTAKPQSQYVPLLLSQLTTPVETKFEVTAEKFLTICRDWRWRLVIRQVYFSEKLYASGEPQFQVTVVDKKKVLPFGVVVEDVVLATKFSRGAEDAIREQKAIAARVNKRRSEHNNRVFTVLRATTAAAAGDTPQAWWEWWRSQHNRGKETPDQWEYLEIVHPEDRYTDAALRSDTPIWTEDGFVPIEQLRAGDRVLSKDVETGELAYQPVLQLTSGNELEFKRLKLVGEQIDCTSDCPIWVSGRGWTAGGNLGPGDRLHTVTGISKIKAVGSGPSEKTFHLVVDRFHTFFTGRAMVLCHDRTAPKPTDAVIPGLSRKLLAIMP